MVLWLPELVSGVENSQKWTEQTPNIQNSWLDLFSSLPPSSLPLPLSVSQRNASNQKRLSTTAITTTPSLPVPAHTYLSSSPVPERGLCSSARSVPLVRHWVLSLLTYRRTSLQQLPLLSPTHQFLSSNDWIAHIRLQTCCHLHLS